MEIMNFYENQTNRSAKQGMERIKKIGKYLKENHLSLNDVVLEHHIDYRWNQRRNRTKREQGARIIGQTNDTLSGFPVEIWWILPKEKKKKKLKEIEEKTLKILQVIKDNFSGMGFEDRNIKK